MVSSGTDGGVAMTFEAVLVQIIAALQHEKRISYRALNRPSPPPSPSPVEGEGKD